MWTDNEQAKVENCVHVVGEAVRGGTDGAGRIAGTSSLSLRYSRTCNPSCSVCIYCRTKLSGKQKICSRVFRRKLETLDLSVGYQIIQRMGGGGVSSFERVFETDGRTRGIFLAPSQDAGHCCVLKLSAIFASLHLFMVSDVHSTYFVWV